MNMNRKVKLRSYKSVVCTSVCQCEKINKMSVDFTIILEPNLFLFVCISLLILYFFSAALFSLSLSLIDSYIIYKKTHLFAQRGVAQQYSSLSPQALSSNDKQ